MLNVGVTGTSLLVSVLHSPVACIDVIMENYDTYAARGLGTSGALAQWVG